MNSYLALPRVLATLAALFVVQTIHANDVNSATEQAMKAASAKVAPTVVKIETAGGAEIIGGGKKGPPGAPPKGGPTIRKGTGPTTGLIVDPNGYIITSSFNFVHRPTDIFVTIPGLPTRLVAKIIASDQTRMLTLLKVEATNLPVPVAYPKNEIEIGQWSIALGRTHDPNVDHPPSMSIGIVSAINRIWGKAIQTDAKTSPVNYGGPLVAIDGRVLGVIVPMSNRDEGETAGVDVYDSGIGFAVPLDDIYAVLPRLKQGQDLKRGLLGITPQATGSVYTSAAIIGAIQPDSAAARAGLQVGDKILEINGKKIPNYSTLQHVLGPMYEGDEITVKISRGDQVREFQGVRLTGATAAYVAAFLGVLPIRDDPGPGVEIRYVYPNSPAEQAGLKAGDRIMKLGPAASKAPTLPPIQNRAALITMMQRLTPNTEVRIEIKRMEGDKVETVTAKLVAATDTLPDKLPLPSSAGKALEALPKSKGDPKDPFGPPKTGRFPDAPTSQTDGRLNSEPSAPVGQEKVDDKPKVETGLLQRTNEALGREYWLYVPDNYDPNKSYGLIVWFHASGQGGKDGEKMAKIFREVCEDHNFLLMGPKSGNADGWVPSETELVMQDVKTVMGQYTIDRTRVVAHGMGNGGQMAFYVGFNSRDVFRGVATVGAVLGTNPKENVANQPLSFFIAVGDKDPLLKDILESKALLNERRFPVVFREMKESGKEYFDAPTFADFLAWIDSLDRI
jgi:S1-C subfamily serine protease/predicted esterase